jgi:hypothetical protein
MKLRLLSTIGFMMISMWMLAQVNSVGIIGTATPGGWSDETPLTQVNDSIWTITMRLTNGEAKFRANNNWDVNWGAREFPRGKGVQNGPNIPIFFGDYTITFNSESGEYFFDVDSDISLIGSATAGGWGADTKMYPRENDTSKFFLVVDLAVGEVKFRTTGSWDNNWGAPDFPEGVGVKNGPNIPINQAGKYEINFDTLTGAYRFDEIVDYQSIGLIGSATPGGWGEETPMTKSSTNPDLWRLVVTLTEGEVKFRANNSWSINWGGDSFPSGTGVLDGPNIAVPAGEYIVTFNTKTFDYNFLEVVDYATIGLIGSATPGGWDADTPMQKDPNDKTIWKLRIKLNNGEAKFRANNDWGVNWGNGDFPEGIAEQDGPNIPITAGDYFVDFNSATGAYKFTEVVEYEKISLVGKTGPFGEWPGSDDSKDTYLNKDPNDFNLWTLPSVTLTNFADVSDGGVKFRANASWTINWGARSFPTGIGVQNGPNIETVAGTYSVTFRSDTGEYIFSPVSSTNEVLDPARVKVFPNPAKDIVTIELDTDQFNGSAQVIIYDLKGNQVFNTSMNIDRINTLNVAGLPSGNYVINIRNQKYLIGKNLIVAK